MQPFHFPSPQESNTNEEAWNCMFTSPSWGSWELPVTNKMKYKISSTHKAWSWYASSSFITSRLQWHGSLLKNSAKIENFSGFQLARMSITLLYEYVVSECYHPFAGKFTANLLNNKTLSSIFCVEHIILGPEKHKKTHRSRNKNGLRCVYRRTVDEINFDCGAFFAKNQRVGTYALAM